MTETIAALILLALTAWLAVREGSPARGGHREAPAADLMPPLPVVIPGGFSPSTPMPHASVATLRPTTGAAVDLLPRTADRERRVIDLTIPHGDPERLIQSEVIVKPGAEAGPLAVARLFAAIVAFGVLLGIGIIGAFQSVGILFQTIIGG